MSKSSTFLLSHGTCFISAFIGISESILFCAFQYSAKSSGTGSPGFIFSSSNPAPAMSRVSFFVSGLYTPTEHRRTPGSSRVPALITAFPSLPVIPVSETAGFAPSLLTLLQKRIPPRGLPPPDISRTNSAGSPIL